MRKVGHRGGRVREEWKEIRFNDRASRKGRIEKSCRRPRRIGADERKEFGEWECHDLFFHYNGNAVRDGEGQKRTRCIRRSANRRGISTDHRYPSKVIERNLFDQTRWKFRNFEFESGFVVLLLLAHVRVRVRVEIQFVFELFFSRRIVRSGR